MLPSKPGPGQRLRGAASRGGIALLLLLGPAAAAAQDGFMFHPPRATLTLRVGPALYNTGSDVFDQLRRDLTLDRRDFRGTAAGLDMGITAGSRLDIVIGLAYAQAERGSEFRDWVDQDEQAIEQLTSLRTLPVTVSARYLLTPRGRSVGTAAWLHRSTVPYVGAGGGATWYQLKQRGDFVDFTDYGIFHDVLETSGFSPIVHAFAGVDHWLAPKLGLNAELRYNYGRATPNQAFRDFDHLDLSGLQATLGFSVRW
jgi:hypothetical protein